MKALLWILILYYLQALVISEPQSEHHGKHVLRKHKKFSDRMRPNIAIWNSERRTVQPNVELKTKQPDPNSFTYTVFPPVIQKKIGIPESLYFPIDQQYEHRPRVKKLLPEFELTRAKRSADGRDESLAELSRVKRSVKTTKPAARNKPKVNPAPKKSVARHNQRKKPKSLRSGARNGTKKGSRRLISARDGNIEDYPYVVSIQKDGQHWCSGALLNPRLVITTANCVWKSSSISKMKIRAGSVHATNGGQTAYIQEVRKHPKWNIRMNPDNDVALLLLDRNLKFSHTVHGADLPNRVMMPPFDDAWVTSWGSERRDGVYDQSSDTTLQVYHAMLMEPAKCNNITKRYGVQVTENFICLVQSGRRAPCTRDTGAPAVSDGVIWGLASWSIRKLCGTERFPAMFSYLAANDIMDFIINATHLLMADERMSPFKDRFRGK